MLTLLDTTFLETITDSTRFLRASYAPQNFWNPIFLVRRCQKIKPPECLGGNVDAEGSPLAEFDKKQCIKKLLHGVIALKEKETHTITEKNT